MNLQSYSDFIDGFAHQTGLPQDEAVEQWTVFSSQLPDDERDMLEDGGFATGLSEGDKFNNQ
jgi:hypothetical protein